MNTTDQILVFSLNHFLKYGIKSVSMDDIANGLGMSKKTIYEKVGNKEQLVLGVVNKFILDDTIEVKKIQGASNNAIEEMVSIASFVLSMLRKISPTVMYDMQKYYPAAWHQVQTVHFAYVRECIKLNIERGKKEGLYRQELNEDIVSKLYIYLGQAISDHDNFPPLEYERQSLFKEIINYHLHGMMNDVGRKKLSTLEIY